MGTASDRVMYVGIGFRKQQGKDTLAEMLSDELLHTHGVGVAVVGFADPLKRLARATFGLTHAQCWGSNESKNSLTGVKGHQFLSHRKAFGIDGAHDVLTARQVLQYLGVEMRDTFPGIWANAPFNLTLPAEKKFVIVPDVRFPDEACLFGEHGGVTIRVDRDGGESPDRHVSETALEGWDGWDYHVSNVGDLGFLRQQANNIAECLIAKAGHQ